MSFTEILNFKNFICKEKYRYSQNEKQKKRKQEIFFSKKFMKWKIYFGPLVLTSLKFNFGVRGHKMQTSFKKLASKSTTAWRLHQTSG